MDAPKDDSYSPVSEWRDALLRAKNSTELAQDLIKLSGDGPWSGEQGYRIQSILRDVLWDAAETVASMPKIDIKGLRYVSESIQPALMPAISSIRLISDLNWLKDPRDPFEFYSTYGKPIEAGPDAMLRLVLRKPSNLLLSEMSQVLASVQLFVWFLYYCQAVENGHGRSSAEIAIKAKEIVAESIDRFPLRIRTAHYGSPLEIIACITGGGGLLYTLGMKGLKWFKTYSDLSVDVRGNDLKIQEMDVRSKKLDVEALQHELQMIALDAIKTELAASGGAVYSSVVREYAQSQLTAAATVLTEVLEIQPIPPADEQHQ